MSRRRFFWGLGMSPVQRGVVVLLVAAVAFASVDASSLPHWLNFPISLIIALCLPSIAEVIYRATHRGNDDK